MFLTAGPIFEYVNFMALVLIWVILFFRLYSNSTASHPLDFFLLFLFPTFCNLTWMLPQYCYGVAFAKQDCWSVLVSVLVTLPCRGVLLLYPSLAHLPGIISGGTGVCWRMPLRPCTCWNYSILFVIHGKRNDQLEAFLKQKPHGVSHGKAFADGGLVTGRRNWRGSLEWALWHTE